MNIMLFYSNSKGSDDIKTKKMKITPISVNRTSTNGYHGYL